MVPYEKSCLHNSNYFTSIVVDDPLSVRKRDFSHG